ncbi:MAG: phage holin family protein [Gemmatimonadetes bacterium]|nr:phage holin family protein [Gemmatimonadota bacterium]
MNLILRLVINAAALYAATRFVDGITYTGEPTGLLGVAVVFAVVNTFIKPVVKFFSFPVIFLTLGLFTLVVNGLMLMLTAHWSSTLGFAFTVRGLGPAWKGALVVTLVSYVLSWLLVEDEKERKKRKD